MWKKAGAVFIAGILAFSVPVCAEEELLPAAEEITEEQLWVYEPEEELSELEPIQDDELMEIPETDLVQEDFSGGDAGRDEALTAVDEPEDAMDDLSDGEDELSSEAEEGALGGPVSGAEPNMVRSGSGETDNRNGHNYRTWASVVYSYLVTEDTGYMRVEYTGSEVKIQHFDREYHLLSEGTVSRELSLFGGFYEGSDSFYLVFGQKNPAEDDSTEVIRVVKYDKGWNRIGHASLLGANTTVPFDAGSLRMTEYNGYLYVRTAHEMYKTMDGINHQSNLTIEIRESDMQIVDSQYIVWNISSGYVSHSFNQFIIADDAGRLVTLDHGDAHPRSAVLCRYPYQADTEGFVPERYSSVDTIELIKYYNQANYNYTNAAIGGLEYSSSSYLTAGTSSPQNSTGGLRNVYVTCVDRDFSGGQIIWYTNTNTESASNPHLVKITQDTFLLVWSIKDQVQYAFLNDRGQRISEIYQAEGILSDCKPAADNNGAVWYVTDGEKLTFYRIGADGTFTSEVGHLHSYEPEMRFENANLKVTMADQGIRNNLICSGDGVITYSSSDPAVASVGKNGEITLNGYGSCTITASVTAGVHYAAKETAYTLTVEKKTRITGLFNSVNGADIRWSKVPGADGYVVYRKRSGEKTVKAAVIHDGNTVQCYDTSIRDNCWGRVYHYYVKVLSGGKEGPQSEYGVLQRLAPMKITKASNTLFFAAELEWKCTASANKALGYEIQMADSKEDLFAMRNVTKTVLNGRNQLKIRIPWLEYGKTYYFRVRCYVDYTNSVTGKKTKTWSQYSNVASVKINM